MITGTRFFLFTSMLCASAALFAQTAGIEWLPDGAEYTLQCSGTASGERNYRVGSKDGEVKLDRIGRDAFVQGPAWALLFTDIGNEFENGTPTKKMRYLSGSKEGLTKLEVGAATSVEYEWARGSQSANRTHSVKVEEKKTVKTESFGEQEVFVVSDTVSGRIHNMKTVTHYAPSLKTFVYRSFQNFNTRDRFECNLTKVKTP